jgi:hypothetical protein
VFSYISEETVTNMSETVLRKRPNIAAVIPRTSEHGLHTALSLLTQAIEKVSSDWKSL